MGRDRTKEMQKATGAFVVQVDDEKKGGKAFVSDDQFHPLVDSVVRGIKELERLVAKVGDCHEGAYRSVGAQDQRRAEYALDEAVKNISDEIGKVKASLKTLQALAEDPSVSRSQQVARRGRQQTLSARFRDTLEVYREVEYEYRERHRKKLERQYRLVCPNATDAEVEKALSDDPEGEFFLQAVQSNKTVAAKDVLREVENRHNDIVKIERTIRELTQLFLETNQMVTRQQTMIDSIENAVETTNVQVKKAGTEVEKAIVYRRKSRKRIWCLLLLLMVLLIIAGLVIYFTVIGK